MNIKPSKMLKKIAYRYARIALVLWIISIIVVAVSLLWYFKIGEMYIPIVDKDFKLYHKTEMSNEYRYLNIETITKPFESNERKICLVKTKEDLYIVVVNDEILKELEEIQKYTYGEIKEKPEAKIFDGMALEIDEQLERKVIEKHNEIFKTTSLKRENFDSIAGTLYLDLTQKPGIPYVEFTKGFALVFGCASIYFFFYMLGAYMKSSNIISNIKKSAELIKLNEQLEKGEILRINKYGVILTDDFILDGTESFVVAKYSNIKWIYPVLDKRLKKVIKKSIMIETLDGKRKKILTLPVKAKKEIDEIYRFIISKSPNILNKEEFGGTEVISENKEELLNEVFGEKNIEDNVNEVKDEIEKIENIDNVEKIENNIELKDEKDIINVKQENDIEKDIEKEENKNIIKNDDDIIKKENISNKIINNQMENKKINDNELKEKSENKKVTMKINDSDRERAR